MRTRADTRTRIRAAVATAVSAALVLAIGAGAPAIAHVTRNPVRLASQWAGKVEGTDAYISVFTLNNGQAGAYLADGADIATLVRGTRTGGVIDLRPNEGTDVTASVAGESWPRPSSTRAISPWTSPAAGR
jgi:hypothetical protein